MTPQKRIEQLLHAAENAIHMRKEEIELIVELFKMSNPGAVNIPDDRIIHLIETAIKTNEICKGWE